MRRSVSRKKGGMKLSSEMCESRCNRRWISDVFRNNCKSKCSNQIRVLRGKRTSQKKRVRKTKRSRKMSRKSRRKSNKKSKRKSRK